MRKPITIKFLAILLLISGLFISCSKDDSIDAVEETTEEPVEDVNAAPVAVDDYDTTIEDTTIIVDVLSNDSDEDGNTISIEEVVTTDITTAIGAVEFSANGEITFIPEEDFTGTVTIPYVITDGKATASAELVIFVHNLPEGDVTTFAGSGSSGGTNGIGTAASFANPSGITIDDEGNLYVAEYSGSRIRKISPDGSVSNFVTTGVGTPYGIVFDDGGNLYVASASIIYKVTPAGVVSTLASGFGTAIDVAIDSNNNLYVFDRYSKKVIQITPAGVKSDYYSGNELSLVNINGLVCDKDDNLYLSGQNGKIYKYTPAKELSVYAENDKGVTYGMVFDKAGNLYIAGNGTNVIHKVTPEGVLSTFSGTGSFGKNNGDATSATFNAPYDITIDDSGVLYVADYNNHLIRKIE